ncbi:MAG: hypothetical protein HYS09_08070 [Chloroflexi bacterium]|nr:hypothetical protein [Chloroflexota bacterium]
MNDINRNAIVTVAAVLIVLMGIVIFLAWAADTETIGRLEDFVKYLHNHADNPGKLILTLGGFTIIVLAFLVIVAELAPEEETREVRLEQAGATTLLPAQVVRERLEAALLALPGARAATVQVASRQKGLGLSVDLAVAPNANLATIGQEASRTVAETVQNELGLALAEPPTVRLSFAKGEAPPAAGETVAEPPAADPPAEQPRS